MTAQDTFDRRLSEALLAYAADAAIEPDSLAFAAEIAAAHPRSRFAAIAGSLRRTQLRALWVALALLLLAGAVGAALVGMGAILQRPHLVFATAVPDTLYGRWLPDGLPDLYLDFNSPAVLHQSDGRALESFGSVVAFTPAGDGTIEGRVSIQSSLPCGDASYRVVPGDTPSTTGPSAAPAPSSTRSPRPTLMDSVRFVDPADPCAERRSILADHTWARLVVELVAGQRYDSLDFGEPFQLTLPADAASGLFSATIGAMYELHPNQLQLSHAWWNAAFIDDVPVYRDLCDHDLGTLPDIPGSVDEVLAWLRSTPSIGFDPPAELVVDGRRAVRMQVRGECDQDGPSVSDLAVGGEYYAIPTGDDVILFVVRADTANESKVAERVVLAMHFD